MEKGILEELRVLKRFCTDTYTLDCIETAIKAIRLGPPKCMNPKCNDYQTVNHNGLMICGEMKCMEWSKGS